MRPKIQMYAVPSAGDKCPVKFLLLFCSKTNPDATSLFNRCSRLAISSPTLASGTLMLESRNTSSHVLWLISQQLKTGT